jgi:hypothetical protein
MAGKQSLDNFSRGRWRRISHNLLILALSGARGPISHVWLPSTYGDGRDACYYPTIIHNKVYNKLIMLCLRLPSSKAVHSSGTTNYSCRGTSVRLSTASCGCDTPCAEPLRLQEDHTPVGTAPEDAAYSAGNCLCMALCAIARHRGQGVSTTCIASPKACAICAGLQESHACRERMNNN